MAGLLIVNSVQSHKLNELHESIVRWVERGGVLMVHGGATKLLRAWFGKHWTVVVTQAAEAVLNHPQLSPKRSVSLLPTTHDSPLPMFLPPSWLHAADVGRGDSVYVSPGAGEVCPVALSEFGPARGCVGFLGWIGPPTMQVVVQLVNRQWTPASRGAAAASAPSSPAAASSSSAAAAASSSAAAAAAPLVKPKGGRVTVDDYIKLADQFPQPMRNHLLSLVPSKVPAGWKQRGVDYGCVHSCCGRRDIISLGSLRSHCILVAHKFCDGKCAIWQNVQTDRPPLSAAGAAASSSVGPPLSLQMPELEGSSSTAAAGGALPSTYVLASQSMDSMDLLMTPVAAAASMDPAPLAAAAASSSSSPSMLAASSFASLKQQFAVLDAQWPQFVLQMSIPHSHPQIVGLQSQIDQLTRERDSAMAQNRQLTRQQGLAQAQREMHEQAIALKLETVQEVRQQKRKAEDEREAAEEELDLEAKRRRLAEDAVEASQQELAAAAQRAATLESEKSALAEQLPTCVICSDALPTIRFDFSHMVVCAKCDADLIAAGDPLCPMADE